MLITRGALQHLLEAAIDSETAGSQGVAVIVTKISDNTNVIAYDIANMIDSLMQGVRDGDDPVTSVEKNGTAAIVGLVSMVPADSHGPCYDGYVIQATAARKGYGPLIYDIALSLGKPVIPDRHAVSKQARQVWQKYMTRSDVAKMPLDDIENPRTPQKHDDCAIIKNADSLNNAFIKRGRGDYSSMVNNDSKAFQAYNKALKDAGKDAVSKSEWDDSITMAASDYFSYRYAKDVIHGD
jgi:hypothetical protein